MEPSRQALWNIGVAGWVFYVLGTAVVLFLCYGVFIHIKRFMVGRPANRANNWFARIKDFLRLAIIEGLFHRKF